MRWSALTFHFWTVELCIVFTINPVDYCDQRKEGEGKIIGNPGLILEVAQIGWARALDHGPAILRELIAGRIGVPVGAKSLLLVLQNLVVKLKLETRIEVKFVMCTRMWILTSLIISWKIRFMHAAWTSYWNWLKERSFSWIIFSYEFRRKENQFLCKTLLACQLLSRQGRPFFLLTGCSA